MKKHLTLEERRDIYHGLRDRFSLRKIASCLGRHPSTVSNEIKKHRQFKQVGSYGKSYNPCLNRKICLRKGVCQGQGCQSNVCSRRCQKCYLFCESFVEEKCDFLSKPPYVCDGCTKSHNCALEKVYYIPIQAHEEAKHDWRESRCGFSYSPEEINRIDEIISPLLKKGQSINHILLNHQDEIMISSKSVYSILHAGLLSARALDAPRIVRFRPRPKKKKLKLDKTCRIGRTYENFLEYRLDHAHFSLVEMDTLEGKRGGKVLLTIILTDFDLLLAFIRDANTAASVHSAFDNLKESLSLSLYCQLFSIILTDNGSEFSNPTRIEINSSEEGQSKIYYCDPGMPQQKPHIENIHTLIRRILPKGTSFNHLTQEDISLMTSHINSYKREKLNNLSPLKLFSLVYPTEIIQAFGLTEIKPDDIDLTPSLLLK